MKRRVGGPTPSDLAAPAAVLDVDLRDGDEAGVDPPDGQGAYVLARVGGLPVAELWCTPADCPRDRASLVDAVLAAEGGAVLTRLLARALERPVDRLPLTAADLVGEIAAASSSDPAITVAVCTRERPRMLARCLAAIRASEQPPFEMLVVDSAPTTDESERVARAAGVHYVREEEPGLDLARQRAVSEARSEILAFTDDDAVPERDWTRVIGRAFADNPEVGAVTGLVAPLSLDTQSQLAFEAYGGFRRGLDRWIARAEHPRRRLAFRFGNIGRVGTGANMAFRRRVLERVGPFDPALDVGSPVGGAGDLEMLFRLIKMGESVAYEPSALVRHEHRRTPDELVEQIESWGRGFAGFAEAASRRFPEERTGFGVLTIWLLVAWHARRLLAPRLGERFPRRLVLAEMRGLARGRGDYQRAGGARRVRHDPSTPTGKEGRVERVIDLALPRVPLTDLGDAGSARLAVRLGGRELGAVTVPNAGPVLGIARIVDAIARDLGVSVLARRSGGEMALQRELAALLGSSRQPRSREGRAGVVR